MFTIGIAVWFGALFTRLSPIERHVIMEPSKDFPRVINERVVASDWEWREYLVGVAFTNYLTPDGEIYGEINVNRTKRAYLNIEGKPYDIDLSTLKEAQWALDNCIIDYTNPKAEGQHPPKPVMSSWDSATKHAWHIHLSPDRVSYIGITEAPNAKEHKHTDLWSLVSKLDQEATRKVST